MRSRTGVAASTWPRSKQAYCFHLTLWRPSSRSNASRNCRKSQPQRNAPSRDSLSATPSCSKRTIVRLRFNRWTRQSSHHLCSIRPKQRCHETLRTRSQTPASRPWLTATIHSVNLLQLNASIWQLKHQHHLSRSISTTSSKSLHIVPRWVLAKLACHRCCLMLMSSHSRKYRSQEWTRLRPSIELTAIFSICQRLWMTFDNRTWPTHMSAFPVTRPKSSPIRNYLLFKSQTHTWQITRSLESISIH